MNYLLKIYRNKLLTQTGELTMFKWFKNKTEEHDQVSIKISGMHCSNCAINIDDILEEIDGVHSSTTNYASSITRVEYNSDKANVELMMEKIEELGYQAAITTPKIN